VSFVVPIWLLVIAAATLIGALVLIGLLRWLESHLPQDWTEPGVVALREARGPIVFLLMLGGLEAVGRVLGLDPETVNALNLGGLALAILVVAWFIAALARRLVVLAMARDEALPNATLIGNVAWVSALALGLLIALGTLGVSITPLLTALGVGGLAVALALQPTLTNLFAGIQILASRQVSPGDYVRLSSGEEGYVADVTWRQTTIRALANNLVVVPNSQLASTVLTNFHQPSNDMSVVLQVGVGYDSDLAEVERVTIEVASEIMREVEGGIADFTPFIRYHTFGDSAIQFSVIVRVREYVDQYLVTHEFIKRLQPRYRQAGITIPFPIRTVQLEQTAPASSTRKPSAPEPATPAPSARKASATASTTPPPRRTRGRSRS
jgi:small-conductance mechanosensitive channel